MGKKPSRSPASARAGAEAEAGALAQTVLGELFEPGLSRAQRTQVQIIEAAIRNYITLGIERVTHDSIAETCGLSRTIVQRYFPDRLSLLRSACLFIRASLQARAVRAVREAIPTGPGGGGAAAQLEAYVRSTFAWLREERDHARVWLLLYYYSGIHAEFRALHTELVQMGLRRITGLVEQGRRERAFKCKDAAAAARLVQLALTGTLLSVLTEDGDQSEQEIEDASVRNTFLILNSVPRPGARG